MSAGFTVWFTGLSGTGKSTIADLTAQALRARGLPVVVLDGDEVRSGLSADLGFSREDRDTQVRRVGWICELLTRSGVVAIAALVSPYEAARSDVKTAIGRCLMVHVDASLETLAARDTKGLYRAAAAGRVSDLSGVGDPYEPPLQPDVRCVSDGGESPASCTARILDRLIGSGWLMDGPSGVADTDGDRRSITDEEANVRERLVDLGHID